MSIRNVQKLFFITLGSLLFSVGLEMFLVPNQVIDGGIVGISIILSHLFPSIKLGIVLIILNIPFIIMGFRHIGKRFAFSTLYAIIATAIFTTILHHNDPFTHDPLLAALFGGIVLGIGVGMVIKNGGSLDGTEITAILINKKISYSVGEIVMFMNLFILSGAGFVFGWDRAMYSLLAYYVAVKVIDLVIEGLEETRSFWIISDHSDIIADAISKQLGRGVTFLKGAGGYTGEDKKIIFSICTRLEEATLRTTIQAIDPDAFIAIGHVHDVRGGQFKKPKHMH